MGWGECECGASGVSVGIEATKVFKSSKQNRNEGGQPCYLERSGDIEKRIFKISNSQSVSMVTDHPLGVCICAEHVQQHARGDGGLAPGPLVSRGCPVGHEAWGE